MILTVGSMRILTAILICAALSGCRQSGKPEGQFPLSDVLWVLDTDGTYHAPGSPEATAMLAVIAKNERTQPMLNQKFSVFLLANQRALQPDNPLGNPLIIAGEPATEEMIGASNKVAARYFETARTRSQNP